MARKSGNGALCPKNVKNSSMKSTLYGYTLEPNSVEIIGFSDLSKITRVPLFARGFERNHRRIALPLL
jgi:hypothetical protein